MKRAIIFCFQFLLLSNLIAQFELHSFQIGLIKSGISINNNSSILGNNSSIKEKFTNQFGITTSIFVQNSIVEKLKFDTGLRYSLYKYEHMIDGIQFASDIQNGTFSNINANLRTHNIGIPLMLKYFIGKKSKLIIILGGNINASFSNANGIFSIGNTSAEKVETTDYIVEKINISGLAGLKYNFKSRINLVPHIEYFLRSSEHFFRGTKGNPYSLGFAVEFLFKN